MTEQLIVATEGAVRVLTLNRPEVRNALNREVLLGLESALAEAAEDRAIGAVVLAGAGSGFCSGLDRGEFLRSGADRSIVNATISTVAAFTKPIVAAVNGAAVTAGLELALACDFIVAADDAWFADTHVSMNLFAGSGMYTRLADAVGLRRAKELCLSGRRLGAVEACEYGLANRHVAPDDLFRHCVDLAGSMAGHPDAAVAVKRSFDVSAHPLHARLADERRDWRMWQDRPAN